MASKKNQSGTKGVTVEQAVKELRKFTQNAINFRTSELEPNWEAAERYYNGESDIPEVANRSNVVKTEFRDAMRNTMPSIMRTLLHARTPVEYFPSSYAHSAWVEQQAEYTTCLFWENDGYNQLYQAVQEALKLKLGIMKYSWESDPIPTFESYTKIPITQVEKLIADPLFVVDDYELSSEPGDPIELYNLTGSRVDENGRILIEAIPNYEFLISRNVNSIEQALEMGVHGHVSVMSVAAAEKMGLSYHDWMEIDDHDPEETDHTSSSTARRRYVKESPNSQVSLDLTLRKVTIYEVYVSYDLLDAGTPQIWKFYLGGSAFKYIHHEQVQDSPFALIMPNPRPFTVHGDSLFDLTVYEQDTSTSLLRATIDNAHMANNARFAADPNKTSFEDLYNPAMNAPIRKQAGDTLQVVQTPYTGQGNLHLLQYLDQDIQNKVGVTKAAQGLDPDAMQSTDKDAVRNTIMTSQGQVELMVRNIIETGLIRGFRLLMRLATQHMAPQQLMKIKGAYVPVDLSVFDPDASAKPAVGLGTASPMQKQAALTAVLQRQEMYMDKYGPGNPFTSFAQIYNAQEDLLEANGVHNSHRYFNLITPEVEKQWAEAEAKKRAEMAQQQQEAQPIDPTKAFMAVESGKLKVKQAEVAADQAYKSEQLRLTALTKQEDLDIKRDELAQKRVIELAKIQQQGENEAIKAEQADNDRKLERSASSDKASSGKGG